jgi:hypothetical protein
VGDEKILANLDSVPSGSYTVVRGTKLYAIKSTGVKEIDISTGAASNLAATAGTLPDACTFGAVYRDRLFLAGSENAIYPSRQGDFTDWDRSVNVEDVGRPMVFQLAEAGEIGTLATAMAPHRDASLLAATKWSLWVLNGDPAASGTLRCVSRNVGIIASRAWCKVGDSVVFLANDGLFVVGTDGSELRELSESVPVELRDVASTTTVRLGHDARENGVHIYLNPSTGVGTHWYFDLGRKGFWPVYLPATREPVDVFNARGVLVFECADGSLRSVGGDDDDGTAIQSHLVLGPLRPGTAGEFGMVSSLHGCLGVGSGTVTWRLVAGETPEAACENAKTAIGLYLAGSTTAAEAYAAASGTWAAGRAHLAYPRIRSMWVCIWLQSDDEWAFEGVTVEIQKFGRWR